MPGRVQRQAGEGAGKVEPLGARSVVWSVLGVHRRLAAIDLPRPDDDVLDVGHLGELSDMLLQRGLGLRNSDELCRGRGLGDRDVVFAEPFNVDLDCLMHLAGCLLAGASRRDTAWKIGRVCRVVAACPLHYNEKTVHGDLPFLRPADTSLLENAV